MCDDIAQLYFKELERHKRKASVAELVRGPAREKPTSSSFGATFAGLSHDDWPQSNGPPLEGVLQVNISELPYVPTLLKPIALLQIFASWEEWHGASSYNNHEWIVRTHKSLDNLIPMKRPFTSLLNPCWINWKLVANEIPSYPDNIDLIDCDLEAQFESLNNWEELLIGQYETRLGTKIGGWPYSFQNGAVCGEYVLQVSSEEKANWCWGPNGNAFFGLQNGEWKMSWDFL
jgi:hypothetical protein